MQVNGVSIFMEVLLSTSKPSEQLHCQLPTRLTHILSIELLLSQFIRASQFFPL